MAHHVITGDLVSVRDVLMSLGTSVPLCDLSPDDRGTAELVLAEVLNNIVKHAYPQTPGPIELWLGHVSAGLACRIVDQGQGIPGGCPPPGTLPDGIDGPLHGLPEGGFGWYLILTLTQDLAYERREGLNLLSFTLPTGGLERID
jgi:serine/threonine-protein kinase RsbW